MAQFHIGQEVEVRRATGTGPDIFIWEHARIDRLNCAAILTGLTRKEKWHILFDDGTRAIVNVDRIVSIPRCGREYDASY